MAAPIVSGWSSIDEAPVEHLVLFLPWIHLSLPKETICKYATELGLNLEQRDALLAAHAVDNDGVSVNRAMKVYVELFKDERIARNIVKWYQLHGKSKIIDLFTDCDPEAFEVYKNEIINNPTRQNIILKLSANLPIVQVIKALQEHPTDPVYRVIANEAKQICEKGGALHLWAARCIFLLRFVTLQPQLRRPKDWLLEFFMACSYHPTTRPFASFIHPGYKVELEKYRIFLSTQNKVPSQFAADLVDDDTSPTSPRPQEKFGNRPAQFTGAFVPNSYMLYPFQVELTGAAKHNKNTIICAPTGSGKTLIAVDIIVEHLRQKRSQNSIGRTVVFVPSVPLVEQQKRYIEGKIGTEFCVTKMSGSERIKSSSERLVDILVGDIIVMTPQIFLNMLSSPLKSQRIYLTDFTLMIFDECHHCAEKHPYNVVMESVRSAPIKPQVVGLTASTGTGKSNGGRINHENTIEHIIALCARLTAVTISSVKDEANLEDLLSRIPQPIDDFISVPHPHVDRFAHEIALICDYIEAKIQPDLKELTRVLPNLNEDHILIDKEDANDRNKNGQAKTNFRYFSKMAYIKSEIDKATQISDIRLFLLRCFELLDMLYYTLKYNELFPASLAMKYLQDRFDSFQGKENITDSSKSEYFLGILDGVKTRVQAATRFMADSENKPILESLMKILNDQYHQDPTSRVIIFVEMRRVGADLSAYLNQREEIISTFGKDRVGYITSTNQALSQFGQNANEQRLMLDRFKNGTLNILVATSVAEEGLDVAACNLIIKYNSVGSEKSLTQRKGRARAKHSRAILLALDEKTMSRELDNVRKEYIMNICIRHLQTISEMELQRKIKAKFDEMQEVAAYVKKRDEERKNHHNQRFNLYCYDCGIQFCTSDQLFSLNDNDIICCDPDCWKNTKIEKRIEKLKYGCVAVKCGAWLCQCGRQRGGIFKYGGVFLPTIASNSFTLKTMSGEHYEMHNLRSKGWDWFKENLFPITPISPIQIREMAASLYNFSQTLYEQVEENEKLNIFETFNDDQKKYQFRAKSALND